LTDAAGAAIIGDGLGVPVLVSDDPRRELAIRAAELWGEPARAMETMAVTGTAGKTSTVFTAAAGLRAAGVSTGTIGTLGFSLDEDWLDVPRSTITTPESPDVQALLARMRDAGAGAVVMEVSAHALTLQRVAAIRFDVAAFTNLGHDHLDYYHDLESYFAAKARLFTPEWSKRRLVNVDDPYGRRLLEQAPAATVSVGGAGDYRVESVEDLDGGRRRVRLATPSGSVGFELSMLGRFSVRNAAMAAAMIDLGGVDLAAALPGFAQAQVPGRMQRIELGPGAPNVVVDFAHTPESVAAALDGLPPGRRIAVLGCGGDRDKAKRQPMGRQAALHADVVVVTDDNPRSEDPAEIRAAVLQGAKEAATSKQTCVVDGQDRRSAIALALGLGSPGDWIAILGKGHETGQELAGRTIPFDDAQVARAVWEGSHG
jgi:UDP-N-acetylmuramoyl-L-alanyl-D-glutamate--2,6-diaminopimelate ligase